MLPAGDSRRAADALEPHHGRREYRHARSRPDRRGGSRRTRADLGGDPRSRPALLPGGRARDLGRGLRPPAPTPGDAGNPLPGSRRHGRRQHVGGRQALGEIRQGAARRADALAGQRLRRCRGGRVRGPGAPLPRLARRCPARLHGRAEDRRPVPVAPLRAGAPRHRGHPRRRRGRRERHRQCADRTGHPGDAGRHGLAGDLRGARRGLPVARRFRRDQRPAGGGREGPVRQPAQRRRRQPAPARSRDHRVPAAAVLRLCLGRALSADRGDADRRAGAFRSLGPAGEPADPDLHRPRRDARSLPADRGGPGRARLRHRRSRLQGRRPRAPEAARLGARPQVRPRRRRRWWTTSSSMSAAPAR